MLWLLVSIVNVIRYILFTRLELSAVWAAFKTADDPIKKMAGKGLRESQLLKRKTRFTYFSIIADIIKQNVLGRNSKGISD